MSVVNQFMHNPIKDQMSVVVRIILYLKGALRKGLMFSMNGHLLIEDYTYVDWEESVSDRKSISRYFTFNWW